MKAFRPRRGAEKGFPLDDERGAVIHLAHELSDATVLIFGGGRVGARRARTLAEARVLVVSPRFADADFGGAALVRAEPSADLVRELVCRAGPALVVAATDDREINAAVAAAGQEAGALVNRADGTAEVSGAVDVPATATDGPVVASVSTGGRSPALSAFLRDRIADELSGSDTIAAVTGDLRAELENSGVSRERRRAALRAVVESDHVWQAAREGRNARSVADGVVRDVIETSDRTER